ncbi:uncharacterized protein LOC111350950 [Spodoptera litura]|uniref:Uncharacterized protein LOC111350950 n=1 Tax=Spodoptera litura TaxID=69820 RepID=A0A9J7DUJ8_SPOLT|nr:uncharacterized protein LOC111350950 [Spodoptera litura]
MTGTYGVTVVSTDNNKKPNMRSFIIITVLSALVACYSASVLPSEEEMITVIYDENFPNGTIVSKEELDSRFTRSGLVSSWVCTVPAISRQSQVITLQYLGDSRDLVRRVVHSYTGSPTMTHSPLITNNMFVTITSRTGQEINSRVELYLY